MFQLKTGKQLVIQQEFYRRLLSEYNPHFTLDRYIAYSELKVIIAEIEAEQSRYAAMVEATESAYSPAPSTLGGGMAAPVPSGGALFSQQVSSGSGVFGTTPDVPGSDQFTSIMRRKDSSTAANTNAAPQPPAAGASTQFYTYLYTHSKTPMLGPNAPDEDMPPSLTIGNPDVGSVANVAVTPSAHIPTTLPGRLLLPAKDEMDKSRARITALHAKFFEQLKNSHRRVKAFLIEKETAATHQIEELQKMSETALGTLPTTTIPAIYRRVRNIALFRDLNTVGFQHIMQKYIESCCSKSIEHQEKVRAADAIIANSHLCRPTFDADQQLDLLTSIIATINKVSYEDARHSLDLAIARDLTTQPRILPITKSYFYTSGFVHHQDQGSFALKLICGLGAKPLTKKISALSHSSVLAFENKILPGGELAPRLLEAVRGDDVFIVQSMAGAHGRSMSTSIMQLALTVQTLTLSSAARVTAVIPYMAYNANPNASAAIAELLMVNGCKQVLTLDLRSDQVEGMFGNVPIYTVTALMEFITYLTRRIVSEEQSVRNLVVVSPDGEGVARARRFADAFAKNLNKVIFGAESTALHRPSGAQITLPAAEEDEQSEMINPAAGGSSEGNMGSQQVPSSLGDDVSPSRTLTRLQSTLLGSRQPSGPSKSPSLLFTSASSAAGAGNTGPASLDPLPPTLVSPAPAASPASTATMANTARVFIPIATALKRPSHESHDIDVIGDVRGQHCFVVDTIIDEAVNAYTVAKKLKAAGASRVTVAATHALFSSPSSLELIAEPYIDELIVTDTIPQDEALRVPEVAKKLRILSVAPLLAEAIQRLHSDNCLSTLFDR